MGLLSSPGLHGGKSGCGVKQPETGTGVLSSSLPRSVSALRYNFGRDGAVIVVLSYDFYYPKHIENFRFLSVFFLYGSNGSG